MSIQKRNTGFTLLELLVVVAIIGILAAVTVALLGDAKKGGEDTAVQSNLRTVINEAGLFFLENYNSYLPPGGSTFAIGTCPLYNVSGTNMFSRNKAIAESVAEATLRGSGNSCYNSASAWAVAVGLKQSPGTSWCVDHTGSGKVVNSVASSAINTSSFVCN